MVVVHGGGPTISDWLKRLETPTRFERGLRVTDAPALEAVVAVLGGLINKQLVAALMALGARAVGLSGADGGMLLADLEDEALGFVGRIARVDPRPLAALLEAGFVPVVAPLALLRSAAQGGGVEEGTVEAQLLNVNADTAAGDLARALGAERLIFLTDVPGVRGAGGETLTQVDADAVRELLASGVAAGGMIPKLEAAMWAGEAGADAIILDGRESRQLIAALGDSPPGTVILGSRVSPEAAAAGPASAQIPLRGKEGSGVRR